MDIWNLGYELYVTTDRDTLARKIREDVSKIVKYDPNGSWSISPDAYNDGVDGRYIDFLYKLLVGGCVYHPNDPERRLLTINNGIVEDDLDNFEEYVWDLNDGGPRIQGIIQPIDIYHLGAITIKSLT